MEPNCRVEHALALVPRTAEFQPLIDAIISASTTEVERRWSKANNYATIPKRLLNPGVLQNRVQIAVETTGCQMQQQMLLIVEAIQAYQAENFAGAAAGFLRAGEREEFAGRLEGANRCFQLAWDALQPGNAAKLRVRILRRLGRVAHARERFAEARSWYYQAYRTSRDLGDVGGQVAAGLGLGRVCAAQREIESAREWFARGMALARRMGSVYQWPIRLEIAELSIQTGRLAEAESHLRRVRAAVHRTGDEHMLLEWYRLQSALLRALNDPVGAERLCSQALDDSREPLFQIRLRLELSRSLVQQARLLDAREQLRAAEDLAAREQMIALLVDVYELLGAVSRQRCDEEGFVFFEEALEICREQKLPRSRLAALHYAYALFLWDCTRACEAKAHLERAYTLYREIGLAAHCREVESALQATGSGKLRAG